MGNQVSGEEKYVLKEKDIFLGLESTFQDHSGSKISLEKNNSLSFLINSLFPQKSKEVLQYLNFPIETIIAETESNDGSATIRRYRFKMSQYPENLSPLFKLILSENKEFIIDPPTTPSTSTSDNRLFEYTGSSYNETSEEKNPYYSIPVNGKQFKAKLSFQENEVPVSLNIDSYSNQIRLDFHSSFPIKSHQEFETFLEKIHMKTFGFFKHYRGIKDLYLTPISLSKQEIELNLFTNYENDELGSQEEVLEKSIYLTKININLNKSITYHNKFHSKMEELNRFSYLNEGYLSIKESLETKKVEIDFYVTPQDSQKLLFFIDKYFKSNSDFTSSIIEKKFLRGSLKIQNETKEIVEIEILEIDKKIDVEN